MNKRITDINDLVTSLAATGMKTILSDEVWRCYGYNRRPKRGNIWSRWFPKAFALENFISREVLTMALIDVLNGIKKSNVSDSTRLLIAVGVIDQFLSTTKHLFPPDIFMQNLFSTYAAYQKGGKSKLYEPIILKAKNSLDKKDFAKFMVGTIKLLATEHAKDYLLRSDYIKDVIEESSSENKLSVLMSDEDYKKYAPLISKQILGIK